MIKLFLHATEDLISVPTLPEHKDVINELNVLPIHHVVEKTDKHCILEKWQILYRTHNLMTEKN